MSNKYVYFFGENKAEGNAGMKELLGGKGANLAEMTNLGVPVPPGFTISTEVCEYYYKHNKTYPEELKKQVEENLKKVEKAMGAEFGSAENPLLFSVRSGAAASMPGMMDTILNLGLNKDTVEGLIKKTNNPRFVWDSFRRFLQMFGNVAMGIPGEEYEKRIDDLKKKKNIKLDVELTVEDLQELVNQFKQVYKEHVKEDFPSDPMEQLWKSIDAVFGSWMKDSAVSYRKINNITGLLGTAVNVQTMVFGNMGEDSGTGVCFSRDPATGEKIFYGEYLMNAQGEDVVAGIRTPLHLDDMKERNPDMYSQIVEIKDRLENHYKDMQDMEFTIQEGKLYFLQTRTGKRTAAAAIKIAIDLVKENIIDRKTALKRIDAEQVEALLHPAFDPQEVKENTPISKGLPASPGASVGKVVFTAKDAVEEYEKIKEERKKKGRTAVPGIILVRLETSPEDIDGMNAADGILTARGGMTSHAAVVARGMGKCCVSGCSDLEIHNNSCTIKGTKFNKGDLISLNGTTGNIYKGQLKLLDVKLSGDFKQLMDWSNEIRKLKVRTNADTPQDSKRARDFGAEGIGLCRTEHMFFDEKRIMAVREMILADSKEAREKAINKLKPYQKEDFLGIFEAMEGLPVTIRLLDPPLHEFLPHEDKDIKALAKEMSVKPEVLKNKVESLKEFNPMLGHRGCRLGITYPELYEMQTRAIIEAACELKKKGKDILPEIMIPLVGKKEELSFLKDILVPIADSIIKDSGVDLKYLFGTMIEVPRAAITADQIAEDAEFFSFGTNDLTQMGCGFSRDDAGVFLNEYVEKNIYPRDPFLALDQEGVGELMKIAVEKGKKARPDIKLGICGEHGGEPHSVIFCHRIGLNYVSCSPFRVPVAIMAAAQAALED